MFRALITQSSATHCTAPTGRNGRHCGRRKRVGRLADGHTCGSEVCQLWHAAKTSQTW
ncbi:hypothetical protein [Saccharothrix hoggarensis]|uniref:Uncharacterized protein n=1 Tax=Saccharothrix hoggarensis TaxID=913853 RepID=A0ABW3R6B5_9PSEU